MSVHGKTRSRSVIDIMHSLGLWITYTRVLEISSALCEVQSRQYEEENCICPVGLKSGLFTVAACDNVDHGMNVIKGAVSNVNGNQIPVIAMDQPLYAKAKLIQWTWPEKYGGSKFVFLFGSLHIEQAFM